MVDTSQTLRWKDLGGVTRVQHIVKEGGGWFRVHDIGVETLCGKGRRQELGVRRKCPKPRCYSCCRALKKYADIFKRLLDEAKWLTAPTTSLIKDGIYYPQRPLLVLAAAPDKDYYLINNHKVPASVFATWPFMDTLEQFSTYAEKHGYPREIGEY